MRAQAVSLSTSLAFLVGCVTTLAGLFLIWPALALVATGLLIVASAVATRADEIAEAEKADESA